MPFDPHKTWFTADLHFGHRNIIHFLDRPFRDAAGEPDVDLMDHRLAASFREEGVGDDHDVFIVGDFAYRCHNRRLRELFHAIPGRKHLIPGNHDGHETLALPWDSEAESMREIMVGTVRVVLCHYAMRTWPGIGKQALHLFGHSHGRLPPYGNSIDVGVDVFGMRPVRLPDIQRRLKAWPKHEIQPMQHDHHSREDDHEQRRDHRL